jgi:hypothetical protein
MSPAVSYPTGGGIGAFFGVLLAGGIVGLLVLVAVIALCAYFYYRVIRAGVRDGMMDAMRKTGSSGFGGTPMVDGYPPPIANVGPPPAPGYQGYRGPNG